ncbi:MAG: hypothetical protein ABW104_15945 [Candidatus Thiodiazotropha sp. 6PLUC2]
MEQTTLFIVVGGLLVLTLVLASIIQRYNDFVEERNQKVQRILNRVTEIEALIQRIPGLPVPVEVETLLRQDILVRLQALKQIHPRYEGINQMIQAAEQAVGEVKAQPQGTQLDALRLEQFSRLLKEVDWLLKERRLLTPMTDEYRDRLIAALDFRHAESLYHHHIKQAERLEKEQQLHQAHWHCSQLKTLVEPLVQNNQQAAEWIKEIRRVCEKITKSLRGSA